jgi:tRNA (adenine37-N6)-methyltransferase
MEIKIKPLAWVKNSRTLPIDDNWGGIISEITLADDIPDKAFQQILDFSHLEIIYYFNKVKEGEMFFSRKPRGNPNYPETGIFAQRNKDRPNSIGLSTVELIWQRGRSIGVRMLDAIDGTPVLDIKPVFREFEAIGELRQPFWVSDLLKNYF